MKVRQVLTSTIFPLLLTGVAHAASTSYTSPAGSWSTAANWTAGVPGQGINGEPKDAIINLAGSTVFYQSATNPSLNSVSIDASGAGATLIHALDSLTATTVTVGGAQLGNYNQSGGLLTTNALILGVTGTGNYTQTGGSLVVNGSSSAAHLIIGASSGGVGSFNLSGNGSVTASAITVGAGGVTPAGPARGTFIQSGGTVNVTNGAGELLVGDSAGSAGQYTISGGTLSAKQLYVGVRGVNPTVGNRSFVQSGGVVNISDNLILGGYDGGSAASAGSYTLSGSEGTSVLNSSKVWVGLSGSGTFTQEGGTHNINQGSAAGDHSLLIAAALPGSQGVYNMRNGVLNADAIFVGDFEVGGQGTLNHSGGTISAKQVIVDSGNTAASLGKYVMSGGAVLNTTTNVAAPGLYIVGEFEHRGGTINANSTGTGPGLRNDGTFTFAGGNIQGSGNKVNYGVFNGYGTVSGTGKLINAGAMTFTGGTTTVTSQFENTADGAIEVSNSVAVFDGAVKNSGDFKTTAANVIFNGPFTNSGQFYSDPSVQTFNGGYINDAGGYLKTDPSGGDVFRIGGVFEVQSANSNLWNTKMATLEFFKGTSNTTGNHSLIYAGLDFGGASNGSGFLGYQNNLSWGEVIIGAGNQLVTSGGGALYTEKLTLGSTDLAAIQAQVASFSGDLKIYYDPADNPQFQGQTFAFGTGGGAIAPVPEPSAMLLLGVGAIGLGFRRRRS